MPTLETSIWLALKARVLTLGIPSYTAIAFPNEAFTKPTSGYLRATWIPNINRRRAINSNGTHQRLSLLQIDVFAPKNQNVAIAMEIAGKIAGHFPTDYRLRAQGVTARVTRAPQVAQPIADETHIMVPTTIAIEVLA